MSETRTVESDDSIALGRQVDEATRCEILDHAAISVQQYQRISCTTLYVVEPNPVYFQKLARGRIVALGLLGKSIIYGGGGSEHSHHSCSSLGVRVGFNCCEARIQKRSGTAGIDYRHKIFRLPWSQARTQTGTPDWRLRSRQATGTWRALSYGRDKLALCCDPSHLVPDRSVQKKEAWLHQISQSTEEAAYGGCELLGLSGVQVSMPRRRGSLKFRVPWRSPALI